MSRIRLYKNNAEKQLKYRQRVRERYARMAAENSELRQENARLMRAGKLRKAAGRAK
jgi:hypothetical protein